MMKVDFIFRGYKKMSNLKLKGKSIASNIRPEWEELCETCSAMARAVNWTKEDSRILLKQVRNEAKSRRSN